MLGWKKIAGLLALSASAALLGAACKQEVKETADAPEAVEESVAAVEATGTPSLELLHSGSPNFARRRCENGCLDDFNRCNRGRGSSHSCRPQRERCLDRCRRF